jgi:DNA-binding MurR/RpiR family transcriptional regulator
VAVTDSLLSPLAAEAAVSFTVAAEGAGVFDSHVGMLALTNALVTGAAAQLRRSATDRLDAVEAAWRAAGALIEP